MAKLKVPLLSFLAQGGLGSVLTFRRRHGSTIAEKKPVPQDAGSSAQLSWRHMFAKCSDLWRTLSAAEKREWESAARSRHMTGYAWYISQCLRPNPGIYLPLQGGEMQGDIHMAGFMIDGLLTPVNPGEAARKAYVDALVLAATFARCCRVYNNANLAIPNNTVTTLSFNSEVYDTDSIHNPALNPSRLTCKTAGKYAIKFLANFATDAVGQRMFLFWVNQAVTVLYVDMPAAGVGDTWLVGSCDWVFAVGDFVECRVWQNSGAPLNIMSTAFHSPHFSMARVG